MIVLDSLSQTRQVGRVLADILPACQPMPALFLDGELGAGKTTLTRELVLRLPGGEQAEIASPTFTLVNIYPTRPQVAHFDLYRLEHGGFDPDLEDILFDPSFLVIMEWSCFLPDVLLPENRLHLHFTTAADSRQLACKASGKSGQTALARLTDNVQNSLRSRKGCDF